MSYSAYLVAAIVWYCPCACSCLLSLSPSFQILCWPVLLLKGLPSAIQLFLYTVLSLQDLICFLGSIHPLWAGFSLSHISRLTLLPSFSPAFPLLENASTLVFCLELQIAKTNQGLPPSPSCVFLFPVVPAVFLVPG